MTDPIPGWYDDPADAARLRWWDGRDWGDATIEATHQGPEFDPPQDHWPDPEPVLPSAPPQLVGTPLAYPTPVIHTAPFVSPEALPGQFPQAVSGAYPVSYYPPVMVMPYAPPPPLTRGSLGLSTSLMVLLAVQAGLSLIWGSISTYRAYADYDTWIDDGDPMTATFEFSPLSGFGALVESVANLALIACVIVWCVWQSGLARSSAVHPSSRRASPGWAIGCWFVPVVSLWMPVQKMNDLWHALQHPGQIVPPGGQRTPRHLVVWWTAWIAALTLPWVLGFTFIFPLGRVSYAVIEGLQHLIWIAAAGLAIVAVRAFHTRVKQLLASAPQVASVSAPTP